MQRTQQDATAQRLWTYGALRLRRAGTGMGGTFTGRDRTPLDTRRAGQNADDAKRERRTRTPFLIRSSF